DTVVDGLPLVCVEHEVGGASVAVARLADAAGVDQPLAFGQVELSAGLRHLAVGGFAVAAREVARDVRMADEANALVLRVEAIVRLIDRENVFPHRVTRARVIEASRLATLQRLEGLQVVA